MVLFVTHEGQMLIVTGPSLECQLPLWRPPPPAPLAEVEASLPNDGHSVSPALVNTAREDVSCAISRNSRSFQSAECPLHCPWPHGERHSEPCTCGLPSACAGPAGEDGACAAKRYWGPGVTVPGSMKPDLENNNVIKTYLLLLWFCLYWLHLLKQNKIKAIGSKWHLWISKGNGFVLMAYYVSFNPHLNLERQGVCDWFLNKDNETVLYKKILVDSWDWCEWLYNMLLKYV